MEAESIKAQEVRHAIRKLVAEITERDPSEISDLANFDQELGVDSLMAMEMMVTVDKRFKIDIPEEEFTEIKTIEDAVGAVLRHLPAQA